MEQIMIDKVVTTEGEFALTAFDEDGNGICTLLDPDQDVTGDITEAVDGERLETLDALNVDVKSEFGKIHRALYEAAAREWPAAK